MGAAAAFEFRKALGTPVVLGVMALCLVFTAFMCWGTAHGMVSQMELGIPTRSPEEFEDLARYYLYSFPARSSYFGPFLIGVLVATTDQRTGLFAKTLMLFRSRLLVFAVKALVVLTLSVVLAALAVAAGFGVIWSVFSGAPGFTTAPITTDQALIGLRTLYSFGVWGLIGLGLGLILRSPVAAVVTVLVFTLLLEPALTSMANDVDAFLAVGRLLPGAANWAIAWPVTATGSDSALGGLGGDALQVGPAMLVLGAYGVVLLAVGYLVGVKRRWALV